MSSAETQVPERDCAVCLQKCHYPTQLPCGHIFCFLCVKGITRQNKKCALCRTDIPPDYLDNPVILEKISPIAANQPHAQNEYQWYYEGRNGWWKYDERSNSDLEAAFAAGDTECKLLLAGALYCIDFQNMMQTHRRHPTKRRRVRRDTPLLPAKGIAGIKIIDDTQSINEQTKREGEDNTTDNVNQIEEIIEILEDSDDDVQTGDTVSSQVNGLIELVERTRVLNLEEPTTENATAARDDSEDT